jgi:hypothetical protein
VIALSTVACNGTANPQSDAAFADTQDAGLSADAEPFPNEGSFRVVIPAVPVSATVAEFFITDYDVPVLRVNQAIDLGVGPGFSRALSVQIADPRTICGTPAGTLSQLTLATGSDTAAIGATFSGRTLQLEATDEARTALVVRGEFEKTDASCNRMVAVGTRLPFESRVTVTSARPSAFIGRNASCLRANELRYFGGAIGQIELGFFNVGRPFGPDNVSATAPFEITLYSSVPLDAAPAMLSNLTVATLPARLLARADGPNADREFFLGITPEEVTDFDVEFTLPGLAGSDIIVRDGDSRMGGSRAGRGIIPIIRRVWVGDQHVCDAPREEWFTLVSETPTVCAVGRIAQGSPANQYVGQQVARLLEDGTCTVRLEAPRFAQGVGVTKRITVDFVNINGWLQI